MFQTIRRRQQLGVSLQDDPVLVGLGEDGRDDPLAEGVVQGVIDRRGGHAHPCGGIPVDLHEGRQTLGLHVRRHVTDRLVLIEPFNQLAGPLVDLGLIGAFQRELILGAADA